MHLMSQALNNLNVPHALCINAALLHVFRLKCIAQVCQNPATATLYADGLTSTLVSPYHSLMSQERAAPSAAVRDLPGRRAQVK
jgi:hypothetical protein